jgi:hypothetical protein
MFMFVKSLVSISDVPVVVKAFFHLTELVTVQAMSVWPEAEVFGLSLQRTTIANAEQKSSVAESTLKVKYCIV